MIRLAASRRTGDFMAASRASGDNSPEAAVTLAHAWAAAGDTSERKRAPRSHRC